MKRRGKILLIIIPLIILSAVCILIYFITRPWTPVKGAMKLKGLTDTVRIYRDQHGIAGIYGNDNHDVIFAQGFVHAQDRLWQMEMIRQLGRGTLSSFLGKQTVTIDKQFRILGLSRSAEKSYAALDEESRLYLADYAAGVNAYLNKFKNRLPIEYSLLGFRPKPWVPEDSLLVAGIMAVNTGLNVWCEILRVQLARVTSAEAASQLMFDAPFDFNRIMNLPVKAGKQGEGQKDSLVWGYLNNFKVSWGSNNWVIHGSKTDTGKPLLGNDTHLGLALPSVWYENNLFLRDFQVGGFSIPGLPFVIMGHNNHIFWGITNLDPDVQDLYLEKVDDPENPRKYLFKGEYKDITSIKEIIEIKNAAPLEWEVRYTHHGPVVNEAYYIEDWEPVTLRWTNTDTRFIMRSLIMLNKAKNWSEFREALSYWDGLNQNFVYADQEGNIGYQATGNIPIREKNHSGLVPVPGWDGKSEWLGYIPYADLPTEFNPARGYIATANNPQTGGVPARQINLDFFGRLRYERILQWFESKKRFSIEDMKTMSGDTYSVGAQMLLPYFLRTIPADKSQEKVLAYLGNWDLMLDVDSTAGAIFETWYYYFLKATVSDELKAEAENYLTNMSVQKDVLTMVSFLQDPHNAWFDDHNTPEVEDLDAILRKSLEETITKLTALMGKDPDKWTWGKIHKTTFIHQPVGAIIGFFNKTIEACGGNATVNQAMYTRTAPPFRVIHGTSQRIIMDVSSPDNTLVVNSTGQNGNLFHPNRTDQTELLRTMQFIPMPFSREKIEETARSLLILTSP